MDATELRALRALAERDVWPVNELPDGIDVDILRCLDVEGVIEARYVTAKNQARSPGDGPQIAYSHSAWFSPIQNPGMAGPWEKWLRPQQYDCWNPPREMRVTDRGRASLARWRRSMLPEMPTGPKFEAARALARSFRQMRGDVYPGAILAKCPGERATVPVEDVDYEPSRHIVIGMAMWGHLYSGSSKVDAATALTVEGIVPLIACDMLRPPCGVPRIDAWIIRADAIAAAVNRRMPVVNGLSEFQTWAALSEAYAVLRRRTATLLQEAPAAAREAVLALADVVRQEFPDTDLLDVAARELLAAVSMWKAATGSGSQVSKEAEVDPGQLTKPLDPLTPKQAAVYEIIMAVPVDRGIKGPQILAALGKLKPPVDMDTSTLTKHIIPALKVRGVRNKKGVGYFIEQASLNSTSAP